jgi:hypothetical protein
MTMDNGHDDEAATGATPHATAVALALDQLMSAAEDFTSWTTLARTILVHHVAEALILAPVDDEVRELLDVLVATLGWQRDRLIEALVTAIQARAGDADRPPGEQAS